MPDFTGAVDVTLIVVAVVWAAIACGFVVSAIYRKRNGSTDV